MKECLQTINLTKKMKKPKLILTDIDGVWTDGGMFIGDDGTEFKKFNTSDSAGVYFCHLLDIPIGIITGENTEIVTRRAKKLNIDIVHLGIKDKLTVAKGICKDLGVGLQDVAYIGDDLNDVFLLKAVGISGAPANAPNYIKDIVDLNIKQSGGNGAFREFVETILQECGEWDKVLQKFELK